MGNTGQAEKLKAELEQAKKRAETAQSNPRPAKKARYDKEDLLEGKRSEQPEEDEEEVEVVVLTTFDNQGRPSEVKKPKYSSQHNRPKKNKGLDTTHDKFGNRTRYLNDTEENLNASIDELVRQEKAGVKWNDRYAENIMKNSQFQNSLDYIDEHSEKLASGSKKVDKTKELEQQRNKAIYEHRKHEDTMKNCWFCFNSATISKHLIVSVGIKTYLSLPERGSLTKGHCLIVPMDHTTSTVSVDEDVWQEIRINKLEF